MEESKGADSGEGERGKEILKKITGYLHSQILSGDYSTSLNKSSAPTLCIIPLKTPSALPDPSINKEI